MPLLKKAHPTKKLRLR